MRVGADASAGAVPGFGQADLSNCEREPIHLAASIQPHGALLLVREPDLTIVQASANAADFLALDRSVLGLRLDEIGGDIKAAIAPHLAGALDAIPTAVRCRAGAQGGVFDAQLHRAAGGGLVLELEPSAEPVDLSRHVTAALQSVVAAFAPRSLADDAARIFAELTGYDRVMIYRFDDDGHGEVIAEQRRPELEAYLGNRYPASDIPQIARRLYERNRVRVLVDIGYTPVPLEPRLSPATGADLDMSLCCLRSVSPIHVQYLQNMGVGATLVASLMVNGRLWGLVSCHHYAPRLASFEVRAVCELLAEAVGTRIAALEGFAQAQAELSARRLEQRMVEAISRDGDWRTALFDAPATLLQPLGAAGAALLFDGRILTAGEVPGTPDLREIGGWLDRVGSSALTATSALAASCPGLAYLTPVASGVLAVPISATPPASGPGEYLIWFRPEQVRTVVWGGDPFKPFVPGSDPTTLSPRRSFAQWHQVVEGTAEPWTQRDLAAARLIGDSVSDVVLQFRAVRLLIAQDQLDRVRHQVEISQQPALIADADGRVRLTNEAFNRLLADPDGRSPALLHLEDLLPHLADRDMAVRRLRDVLADRQSWRGEVVVGSPQTGRPLLVRADPVFSAPGRVLGFVFLFTDLSERKAADVARRRFQEAIVGRQRAEAGKLEPNAGVLLKALLASVLENAQLAAFEVSEGTEVARLPELLESLRASVARSTEILEHLVGHSAAAEQQNRVE